MTIVFTTASLCCTWSVKLSSPGLKRPAGSTGGAAVEPPPQKSFINQGSAGQGICCRRSALPVASTGDEEAERAKSFVESDFGIFCCWRRGAQTYSPVWSPHPGTARASGLQSGSAVSGLHTTHRLVSTSARSLPAKK